MHATADTPLLIIRRGLGRRVIPSVRCFPLMGREYYILWYRLDGSDCFLIWYSNEKDGVFVDADGFVPSFDDTGSQLKYARERNTRVNTEQSVLLDLDVLGMWPKEKGVGPVDPHSFNGAWNLFADVSSSIKGGFDTDRKLTRKIYDKLFRGRNLPVVTPAGEHYLPAWTKRELKIIHDVLSPGLKMFRGSVRGI